MECQRLYQIPIPPNSLAITIVNELNADTTLAHQLFPGSIISKVIWICNQIYSEDPLTDESLSYSSLQKKWHKLATLEYIKKAKDLKNLSTKDHNNFKDPMILLTSTIKLRKITANYYCIPESSLPNIISFDQFI
ncbi:hypothetical protein ACTFIV_007871 [Dictyostelium citrinum]